MKNVFTTELGANNAQAVDFQMYKDASPLPEPVVSYGDDGKEIEPPTLKSYWDITTTWGAVVKRIDADEWYYEVCPVGIQTHAQKEIQDTWQSQED